MKKLIPIIIPSYEPDERLRPLIVSLNEANLGPIVVVDDGGEEKYNHYFEEAKELGCTVLVHEVNQGKGRALKDAFKYCLETYPGMLGCVTADSDGQHTPSDIEKCILALEENPDCLVMGCRDFSGENVPWKSSLGNNSTKNVCKFLCGVSVSDTQTGLRAIPSKFMAELLEVKGERFEFETRMLVKTKDNYKIVEVPIETVYDSKENHQTHFRPIKDSIKIYGIFGAIFAKFLFSSLSSSAIDMTIFTFLCWIFKGDTKFYVALSTILARMVSCTYNYLINFHIVFKSKENKGKALLRYIILAVIQMCASALLSTAGVFLTKGHELPVKIVVDVALFCISYIIQREIVFKKR